jgi:AraC-like DNA-binding protein
VNRWRYGGKLSLQKALTAPHTSSQNGMKFDRMPKQAQFSINFVRNILHFAAAKGVSEASLCAAAGFPLDKLAVPDDLVGGPNVERIWQAALTHLRDEALGIHLGEACQPTSLGIIGFAMLSCSTLGKALEMLSRYWSLMSNATSIQFHQQGKDVVLELLVHDLPGNFLVSNRHPAESSLAAALVLAEAISGRPLQLTDAASSYAPPADTREYDRVFRRKMRFDAEANLIRFHADALAWPLRFSNAAMLEDFESQIHKRLRANPETICDRVRTVLAQSLRGQVPSLTTVAKTLRLSERALQRELQLEGTTFRQELDILRRDLAMEYLQDARQHSIADISFLLGFSEPSVLHRYFRRWTGLTPQEFRRRQFTRPDHNPAQQQAPARPD